jgi:muramidase (phage lysozyme)
MKTNEPSKSNLTPKIIFLISLISFGLVLQGYIRKKPLEQPTNYAVNNQGTMPLVMTGGDPYIRALMRTITASEANASQPYHIIYGGTQVKDLSTHPNLCIPITVGINAGNCSTAAGRYQMLNFVWDEKAALYHPNSQGILWWKKYSFEPEYQDAVIYAWLSDRNAWGVDISELLKAGKVDTVLHLLSGTWTSLGYGIETNSMSRHLPQIYRNMLQEELS